MKPDMHGTLQRDQPADDPPCEKQVDVVALAREGQVTSTSTNMFVT